MVVLSTGCEGFNPRPPSLAGVACGGRVAGGRLVVSIRARHRWRALRANEANAMAVEMFQSAPAIAGGRCAWQSIGDSLMDVSIRARHRWRALRMGRGRHIRRQWFQSAPAIAGGRCRPRCKRPCRPKRFNPRPPSLAGVATAIKTRAHIKMFQSAPAIAGGRCARQQPARQACSCFNPRPPSLAGVAPTLRAQPREAGVSIRARHRWRALLFNCKLNLAKEIRSTSREHRFRHRHSASKARAIGKNHWKNNSLRRARTLGGYRQYFRFALGKIPCAPALRPPAGHQNPPP